jgi:holo-[acyl-carrier protein] synthase
MRVRLGVDLVLVPQVRDALARFGARYLERIFTSRERVYAEANPSQTAERLAARFAAKEATFKVLRSTGGIAWRDIEIGSDGDMALSGGALALAHERGLGTLSVSVSHEGDYATAVVAALETR